MLNKILTYSKKLLKAARILVQSIICLGKAALNLSKNKSNTYWADIKKHYHQDHNKRQLRKLPWYLLIGPPASGKKTMLSNAGHHFMTAAQFGKHAMDTYNTFHDYQWWFTNEAVMIDTHITDQETYQITQKKFIRYLRKQRHRKPISGVILTFPISDLLLASNQQRQALVNQISEQIRNFHQSLKTQIPVYLVLTKCDLVAGFQQFFSDLSREEMSQVWGITLPTQQDSDINAVLTLFNREYKQLMTRLQQRIIGAINAEKNPRGRELIYNFPQQMQLFKKPIATFIAELFGATRLHNVLQIRGIYLTSATQTGHPNDFLMAALGQRFQIQKSHAPHQEKAHESFFLARLFQQVIFPEGQIFGYSTHAKKIKHWVYRTSYTLAPTLLIISFIAFYAGYQDNKAMLIQVNQRIHTYQLANKGLLSGDRSIIHTLPALDALDKINKMYHHRHWAMHLIATSHHVYLAATAALSRSLHRLFLPRIAAQLESELNTSNSNINTLYAILKGYLAFSPSDYTEPNAIIAPLEYHWSNTLHNQPKIQQALRYYIHMSVNKRLDMLPLNRPLINKIRSALQEIVPAQRAYGLLTFKAVASDIPNLNIASHIGTEFYKLFNNHQLSVIPALYTKAGFQPLFVNQYQTIAHEVAADNHDIGLKAHLSTAQTYQQIIHTMQTTYTKEYQTSWHLFLNQLTIRPFSTNPTALNTLELLTGDHSPLTQLLGLVNDNTANIHTHHIQVQQSFHAFNHFSHGGLLSGEYATVNKALIAMTKYLLQLTQAANTDAAEFNAAATYMQGNPDNPLRRLSILANKAPQPIKNWLIALNNNLWQVISTGALNHINAAWVNGVISEYQQRIKGRYPLSSNAQAQIGITSFGHFFGPQGTLSDFFNRYLKVFIDTSHSPWKPYTLDGHTLNIPQSKIALFERAAKIKQLYFANGSQRPILHFSMIPRMLDSNARGIQLNIGNQSINYQHGPQKALALTWPLPDNAQQAKLIISDFSNHHYVQSHNGPWSLFQLLNNNTLQLSQHTRSYRWRISLGGHSARFKITTTYPLGILRLQALNGLHLPATL